MNPDIIVTLVLGSMLGCAVIAVFYSLRTRPVAIEDVMQTLNGPAGVSVLSTPAKPSARERAGDFSANLVGRNPQVLQDLAVVERSLEEHAINKVVFPALILLGSYGAWALSVLLGAPRSAVSVLWASVAAIALAAVAFVVPDIRLRSQAETRRLEFRHALSAYLDLVVVIIAGGGGILTALKNAADAGGGWPFEKLRQALDYARLSGRAPWDQFSTLAELYSIDELAELAAAADLAGDEGAKVSDSIATKAAVLRARLGSEAEIVAENRTERMVVPLMGFATALFLFLGFAAAQALLDDTSPIDGDFGDNSEFSINQFNDPLGG